MSNRHQELTRPEQTATGKDLSNSLIVDSLLKTIEFCDKHNMVAFLDKSTGSAGFDQITDFLNRSHICYTLTKKPEIFEQLALMGYHTDSDKLTFQKGAFHLNEFLIYSILSLFKTKEDGTAWEHYYKIAAAGWKLSDAEVQEKASTYTELFIQEVTPTKVIQDQKGSEKASDEVSTAGEKKGTASKEVLIISTTEVSLSTARGTVTYTRRSVEKRSRQDKGKAIMIESKPKKKSKKEIEQERLSVAEAIRLEEQMNKEQRAQIARDAEIARQWDEEERKRAMDEVKSTKKIDWSDPSVIKYHTLKMKPKTVAQARKNMIKYLKNQGNYKINDFKGMSYNEIRPIFERQDVEELYRIVKEKYSASRLEGYDLMLWGDLYTLFVSDEENEIWKKKKYPLSQEMISKMLSRKLEVDHESSQAFELLRFIRSQLQK
ncbi:hypothetical protein Tco_0893777 [Tanacetum coccineum]|uniref:Uncharacterized protein n=1 Tax=Tanacetum coccineum TaxID=301880 RepID=A0ABQ5CAA0_9ASTR